MLRWFRHVRLTAPTASYKWCSFTAATRCRMCYASSPLGGIRSLSSITDAGVRALIVTKEGKLEKDVVKYSKLTDELGLKTKDLVALMRMAEPAVDYVGPIKPGVSVLMAVDMIRGVFTKDRLYLALDNDQQWMHEYLEEQVCDLLCQELQYQSEHCFEERVMSAVLGHVQKTYERGFRRLGPVLNYALDHYSDSVSMTVPLESMLSEVEVRIESMVHCLREVDPTVLIVSYEPSDPRHRETDTRLEVAFASTIQRLQDITRKIHFMKEKISRTNLVHGLELAKKRNKILDLNLYVSCAALVLSSTTVVSGFLGMNIPLPSWLLQSNVSFAVSIVGTIGVASVTAVVLWRSLGKLRREPQGESREYAAIVNLLRHLPSLEHTMRMSGVVHRMSRSELRNKLSKNSNEQITDDELNLLYRIFDVNQDDHLDVYEYLKVTKSNQAGSSV